MTAHEHVVPDHLELEPGDHVRVQHLGPSQYSAVVEECLPALGIVWVRETGTGDRRMVSVEEDTITRC